MILRVSLDANVLFTAAQNPNGLSRLIFHLHRQRVLNVLTSHHALHEAQTNLGIKAPDALKDLDKITASLELIDAPVHSAVILQIPEDDLLIFSAAIAGRATHLLTGDKNHFGRYFEKPAQTAGIQIQTVRRFFETRFDL